MSHYVARVLVAFSLATLLMCCAIGQGNAAEPKNELPLGTWKLVKRLDSGRDDLPKVAIQWVIAEKSITYIVDGKAGEANVVAFDAKSSPRAMDLTLGRRPIKYGVWEIKDGKLRVCLPDVRGETRRPTGFDERRFATEIMEFEKMPESE